MIFHVKLITHHTGVTLVMCDFDDPLRIMIAREVKLFWSKKPVMLKIERAKRRNGSDTLLITNVKYKVDKPWEYVGDREIIIHSGNRFSESQNCLMPGRLAKNVKVDAFTDLNWIIVQNSKPSTEIFYKNFFKRAPNGIVEVVYDS